MSTLGDDTLTIAPCQIWSKRIQLRREHRVFRLLGPRLLDRIEFRGGPAMDPLLRALSMVRDLAGDGGGHSLPPRSATSKRAGANTSFRDPGSTGPITSSPPTSGDHFGHVSTGLPPKERRALLATLIAEVTNLGLSRMADVCGVASRRALLRMLTWHLREKTFRSALACLTDAIHAEPLAAWFGEGWRANADGQAYYLGGPGEAGGSVNAHYGRDPMVKIYTTVSDRYAPLGQTLIAGTASEAVHALDALLGHESDTEIRALHTDGGGVSDMVFAVTHLLGLDFEPRIPRLFRPTPLCVRVAGPLRRARFALRTASRP